MAVLVKMFWRLMRFRTHRMRLEPDDSELVCGLRNRRWQLLGDGKRIPDDWVMVTVGGASESRPLMPAIIATVADGSSKRLSLPFHVTPVISRLVRLPDGVTRLELEPIQWPGSCHVSRITMREVGLVEVIARMAAAAFRQQAAIGLTLRKSIGAALRMVIKGDFIGLWNFVVGIMDWAANRRVGAEEIPLNYWILNQIPDRELEEVMRARDREVGVSVLLMAPGSIVSSELIRSWESLLGQVHSRWEVVLVGGDGSHGFDDERWRGQVTGTDLVAALNLALKELRYDLVTCLEVGDRLISHVLYRIATYDSVDSHSMFYGDELVNDENGELKLLLKPAFSYDLQLSYPYLGRALVWRRELLDGVRLEGVEINWYTALAFALIERARRIHHFPEIWYLRESKNDHIAAEELSWLVNRHLQRSGSEAIATPGAEPGALEVRWRLPDEWRARVVIPTKNRYDLLKKCIDSIVATCDVAHYRLTIVDHQSTDRVTKDYLASLALEHQVIPFEGPFNFSRIINHAVAGIGDDDCDLLLLLNNDIEAMTPGWLERMAEKALRPDTGVVGALLLFPNGTIQHAGVVIGLMGVCDHFCRLQPFKAMSGVRTRPQLAWLGNLPGSRDYSAVTGACMMMRRSVFEDMGGLDERFAVGFNDIDFCLRVRKSGLKVVLDGNVVLWHHESVSRGRSLGDPHRGDTALFKAVWDGMVSRDCFFHPYLSDYNTASVLEGGFVSDIVVTRVSSGVDFRRRDD